MMVGCKVKDIKLTSQPETGKLYQGSVIDNLAMVQWDGDHREPKRSFNCLFL